MRLVAGALLVLSLVFAGSAWADRRIPVAQRAAAQTFRPDCESITVTVGDLVPADDVDPSSIDAQTAPPCGLRLNPTWTHWKVGYLCAVMTHEYGHLIGLPHSPDPHSIMNANFTEEAYPPPCKRMVDGEWRLDDILGALPEHARRLSVWRHRLARYRSRHERRKVRQARRVVRRLRLIIRARQAEAERLSVALGFADS